VLFAKNWLNKGFQLQLTSKAGTFGSGIHRRRLCSNVDPLSTWTRNRCEDEGEDKTRECSGDLEMECPE
jgi:hypothetical protein